MQQNGFSNSDNFMEGPLEDQAAFDNIQPESRAIESLGAAFKLSAMDTTTHSLSQYNEISDAEKQGGEAIQPKELNEMYPDLTVPFTEPRSRAVADIIASRQRKRNDLMQTIANGPQGRVMGAVRFGAAMIPHAIDPINVGSGLAISAMTAGLGLVKNVSEAAVAAEGVEASLDAVGVAKASRAAGLASKAASSPFIRHFGEGVIGNAASESLVARAAVQEGREYNLDDAFYNTVGGALLVPGVAMAAEKAVLGLRYTGKFAINRAAEFLARIDPKYAEIVQASSVARLFQDKLPVPGVFHEHAQVELRGEVPSWADKTGYAYERLSGRDVPRRTFYAASYDPASAAIGKTESFDHFLGEAVYASDSPVVVNGAAARDFKEGNGRVIELANKEPLNLIELGEKMPEELRSIFREQGVTVNDLESKSVMEIMNGLQDKVQSNELGPEFIDQLNSKLKDQGFDGYISDGTNAEGLSSDPHNSLVVFNKDKMEQTGEHAPEPEKKGQLPPERLAKLQEESQSEVSQLTHEDPNKLIAEYEASPKEPIKSPELRDLEADELILNEAMSDLEKQDLLEPAEQKVFDEVKEAQKDSETLIQMMKYAASCVGLD